MQMKLSLRIASLFIIPALSVSVCDVAQSQTHKNNGAFLGHAYVTTASYISAHVPTDASNFQFDYGTNKIFVNCGTIGSDGKLLGGASTVPQVVAFLDAIASWEASNPGYTFKVFAYVSGDLISTDFQFIDVSNSTVRSNIAAESAKFTSTSVSGSYIAGAGRTFDGVLIDFEPAGGTSATANTQFNNLKSLMDEIKTSIGSSKLTAFAAPQYSATSTNRYVWCPTFYYYMALHVNYLMAMTYDSQTTTGSAYQTWMKLQAEGILQAVSGEYWGDGSHPAPTNGVKVLFGFPAYPNNPPNHYASVETVQNAAIGVSNGLAALDSNALANFGAAAVYLTTDGSGTDGYASFNTDWNALAQNW
jgi:hypothetical protein